MTKKEAYRVVHDKNPENSRYINFNHKTKGTLLVGSFYRSDQFPYKIEIDATIRRQGREEVFKRQARNMEDAIVWLFNGFNENPGINNRYSSLEDIIFEGNI